MRSILFSGSILPQGNLQPHKHGRKFTKNTAQYDAETTEKTMFTNNFRAENGKTSHEMQKHTLFTNTRTESLEIFA